MSITLKQFKCGDVRQDGFIFHSYNYKRPNPERWCSPLVFHQQKLNVTLQSAKRRALQQGLPFDIDQQYLRDIFPKDFKCPIFGTEMAWGMQAGGRSTSPSLDRIIPALGYTKGNVVFISDRANRLKQDASMEDLRKLLDFYTPLIERTLH